MSIYYLTNHRNKAHTLSTNNHTSTIPLLIEKCLFTWLLIFITAAQDAKSQETEKPNIILSPSNVMARTGEKIKLDCEVSGNPTPLLSWTNDGKSIEKTTTLKVNDQTF